MITPEYLKKGDAIGIVAPARFIEQKEYPAILQFIETKGFVPVRGKTTWLESGIFAGTDEERATDLQTFLDDPSISSIFCLRGGYGTMRILDKLNFSQFTNRPKWITGFSDITALHARLAHLGIESIHGQMPVHFQKPSSAIDTLFRTLSGEKLTYQLGNHALNRMGSITAPLAGGNLSMICAMMGTPFALPTRGTILFIEDVGEPLYRLDRMMQQLKLAGTLENLAGLIVGGLTNMEDSTPTFGSTTEEIILDAVKDYTYPVCFNFPAGHISNNQPLILGRNTTLTVDTKGVQLQF